MKIVLIFFAGFYFSSAGAFTLNSSDPNQRGWSNKTVTFKLNTSNCPANIGDLLNAATGAWNSVATSSLSVKIEGVSTSTPASLINGTATDTPVVACDPNFGTTFSVDPNQIAGAGFIGSHTNPIDYGALVINVQAGTQGNVGALDSAQASVVLAHEIGHVLGLGHSADGASLMFYSSGRKTKLGLSQDDIDGVSYLYPRDETGKDPVFGCGRISSGPTERNPAVPTTALLLFLPLILILSLRFSYKQKRAISN